MNIILVYPGGTGTLPFGVPLGIASIAGVLRELDHDVSVVDFRFENEAGVIEMIKRNNPRLIGFYASTDLANAVLRLGEVIRAAKEDARMVVGGPHATLDPAYFISRGFDVAVIGEGEATIAELVNCLEGGESLSSVRGIAWRDRTGMIQNESRPFIEDLDSLPLPAYDLFPNVRETLRSNLFWSNLLPFTHVLVSRGCPFSCSFCQPTLDRMFGKRVRRMSPGRAVQLLRFLESEFGVREVFLEDDLFLSTAFRGWLSEFTRLILEQRVGVRWWAQARADSTDRELLLMAKRAGCYMVMCGVESGSQKVLDFYRKRITVAQVRSLFRMCREIGLMAVAEIIYGAPMETTADVAETLRLLEEIRPDGISPCILTPYPGTYVHEWLVEHGVGFNTALDGLDRTVHQKRIDSPIPDSHLRRLALSSVRTTPSLKLILTRPYYRRAYFEKLHNLLSSGHFRKAIFLLLMSVPRPFMWILTLSYFKLSRRLPVLVTLKNLVKH